MITSTPELELWRGMVGFEYTWTSLVKVPTRAAFFQEVLAGKTYDKILEVGCNIGHNLDDLKFTGAELYGLDPCMTAIKEYNVTNAFAGVGMEEFTAQIAFTEHEFYRVCGTGFTLPFPTKSFDLVLAAGVLCHISGKDLPEAISELFRVGKSVLVVDYYNSDEIQMAFRQTKALWERDFFSCIDKKPVDWGAVLGFDPTREMNYGLWEV